MSFLSKTKHIQGFFADNFSAVAASKIAWPNEVFSVPDDFSAWVSVNVEETVTNFTSVGRTARTRREGIFSVQIYTAANKGTAEAETIADAIRTALEGRNTGEDVIFRECQKTRLNQSDGWYSVLVTVPFYYDDNLDLS